MDQAYTLIHHENIAGSIFAFLFLVLLIIFYRRFIESRPNPNAPGWKPFRHAAFSAFGYFGLNLTRIVLIAVVRSNSDLSETTLVYIFKAFDRLFISIGYIGYGLLIASLISSFAKGAYEFEKSKMTYTEASSYMMENASTWIFMNSYGYMLHFVIWVIAGLIYDFAPGQDATSPGHDSTSGWINIYVLNIAQLLSLLVLMIHTSRLLTLHSKLTTEARGLRVLMISLIFMSLSAIMNVVWEYVMLNNPSIIIHLSPFDFWSLFGFIALALVASLKDPRTLFFDPAVRPVAPRIVDIV